MTSIPFTFSSGVCSMETASNVWSLPLGGGFGRGFDVTDAIFASALLAAIARRDLLLRRIGLGGGLDQRLLELLVGLQPVGGVGPLLAVPRVDAAFVHAGMVAASS